MTRYLNNLIALGALLCLTILTSAQNAEEIVRRTVAQLENEHFKDLNKSFNDELRKSVRTKDLKMIWEQLTTSYGKYSGAEKATYSEGDEGTTALIPVNFEKGAMTLRLKISDEEIAGIYFAPNSYTLPKSVQGMSFGKKQITVGADTFKLDGELVVPRSGEKCPVIILVHGSGPMDMDESVYASKVFKDLALVLATKGIATLRYDKRSKVYPELFEKGKDFTLAEETIDDALSAVEFAKSSELIDTNRIFVLGHSLGAYAIPCIVEKDQRIAGGIVMAGPARQLYEILPDQYRFLLRQDGKLSIKDKMIIRKMDKTAEQLRGIPDETPKKLKMPIAYWPIHFFEDIHAYDPVETISREHRPFLILQGELDYQVSYEHDFSVYRSQLHDRPNVTLRSYPELDHLMMDAEGNSSPSDYFQMRNVDPTVIDDIAQWVRNSR